MTRESSFSTEKISEGSGKYNTPVEIVKPISEILNGFELDPCASKDSNIANTNIRGSGGLEADWSEYETVWLNHPYGRGEPEKWLHKAVESDVKTIVALSKADPSTKWFDQYIWQESSVICFPSSNRNGGRIQFVKEESPASFPNVFSVFGICPPELQSYFTQIGPTCENPYKA